MNQRRYIMYKLRTLSSPLLHLQKYGIVKSEKKRKSVNLLIFHLCAVQMDERTK